MYRLLVEKQRRQLPYHARIQEFSSGGRGGGPGQSDKKSCDNVFCFFFLVFFSPQLILQKSNGQFKKNYHFSRFQGGSNIFQGSNFFQGGGGSNCLFPIETHISCDFPWGVRTPCPPPWIRTCILFVYCVGPWAVS